MRPNLFALAFSLLTGSSLLGGVVVEINGVPYTLANPTPANPPLGATVSFSGTLAPDVTIAFSTQVVTVATIRIFDSITDDGLIGSAQNAAVPQAGIGRLSLVGSAASTARINLLIADADQAFPSAAAGAAFLEPGLTTLGGSLPSTPFSDSQQAHEYDQYPWASVNSGGDSQVYDTDPNTPGFQVDDRLRGIIIPDPSLRRQTVLAAVVSQDVCPGWDAEVGSKGRIEVGQVLCLHAIGSVQSDGTVIDGNINAHVIAVARDQYLTYGDINDPPTPTLPGVAVAPTTTGFRAIENVTGGNAIRGSVIAKA